MSGDPAPTRSRRELAGAVLLAAVGGALLLLAASRGWVTLRVDRKAPLPPLRRTISGSDAQPLLYALGLVGLAAAVAILATRRIGRLVIGTLLLAAGVLTLQRAISDLNGMAPGHVLSLLEDAGPVVGVATGAHTVVDLRMVWVSCAVIAAVLLVASGVLTVMRAGAWPVMGRKYERGHGAAKPAPDAAAAVSDRNLWDAMDRGDDLTEDTGRDTRSDTGGPAAGQTR